MKHPAASSGASGYRIPRERERENAPRGGEYALLLRERLIDLDDRFLPARIGEFFDAKEAREEASAIAQLLTLDDFKICDVGIDNSKSAHDAPLDSLVVS